MAIPSGSAGFVLAQGSRLVDGDSLQRQLALDALKMALAERQPPRGLIHHSDHGSQYAGSEYQQLLAQHGIIASMSRSGNCWDNAVAESFFATLKLELVYPTQWSTRASKEKASDSKKSSRPDCSSPSSNSR